MVREELDDGVRIAQLLASELDGLGGDLDDVQLVEAEPDVEPTADGAFAYAVALGEGQSRTRLAEVFVQHERARIEFSAVPAEAAEAAEEENLRVRPKASTPPRTLVFAENGAEAKRVVAVVWRVVAAVHGSD